MTVRPVNLIFGFLQYRLTNTMAAILFGQAKKARS